MRRSTAVVPRFRPDAAAGSASAAALRLPCGRGAGAGLTDMGFSKMVAGDAAAGLPGTVKQDSCALFRAVIVYELPSVCVHLLVARAVLVSRRRFPGA